MNITSNNQTIIIQDVKSLITENIGKSIRVIECNKQGKIIGEFAGKLVGVYACFFVLKIKVKESYINKSFSYVDFFTKTLSFQII